MGVPVFTAATYTQFDDGRPYTTAKLIFVSWFVIHTVITVDLIFSSA